VNIQHHLIQEQPAPIPDSLRGSGKNADKRWAGTTPIIKTLFCLAGNAIQAKIFWSAGILLQAKALPLAGIQTFRIHPSHPIFGRFVTRPKMGCLVKIERNFCGLFYQTRSLSFKRPSYIKQNPQVLLPTGHSA